MKLMLTSAGITNKTLASALRKLVKGKIRIAFIPTAANVEKGEKDWLVTDYVNCQKLGSVDIVDISAVEKFVWLPRLKKANVIFVGGGNTGHLMRCINSSGLREELPLLLEKHVYVGISAGSMVLSKQIQTSSEYLYWEKRQHAPSGLGYINFHFRPHLNSPDFPRVRHKILQHIAKKLDRDMYALDDNSAIVYVDGKIKVVSEGKWIKYTAGAIECGP